PIAGADLWLESQYLEEPARICALVQNQAGYRNLVLLISRGWQLNQQRGRALIKREWLEELHDGLILLSCARHGEIGQLLLNGKEEEASALATRWQQLVGDRFYLEVQRTSRSEEHTSELQSRENLVCRLLLEKKKKQRIVVCTLRLS